MDHSEAGLQDPAPHGTSTPSRSHSRRSSLHISRKTSWGTPIPPPSSCAPSNTGSNENIFDDVDLDVSPLASDAGEGWNTLDNITALGLSFTTEESPARAKPSRERFSLDDIDQIRDQSLSSEIEPPFHRWMKSLHKKSAQGSQTVSYIVDGSPLEAHLSEAPAVVPGHGHKKSNSGSSFGFVSAVKSASISLASLSVAQRSRKTGISSRRRKTDRSSKTSTIDYRLSEDSSYVSRGAVNDQAVTNRLLQRRRVLEELISTEESYVADVRFLMNVRSYSSFPWSSLCGLQLP